ncbi:hypothetical protein RB620_24560 [Paenibacillus sp. LHD-117]|nr:hypothetical protein [Paenibacillus sp. LHD-117]MDQ6422609.1 hypothetical protein [Paenibacillus sp. LHD-117]
MPEADPEEQLIDDAVAGSCSTIAAGVTFLVRGRVWPAIEE